MILTLIEKLLEKEDYVKRVEYAEKIRMTFIPKLYQKTPVGELRPREDIDIKGRWSLGWRPK